MTRTVLIPLLATVIPATLVFIAQMTRNRDQPRAYRRLSHLIELQLKLPEESTSKEDLQMFIDKGVQRLISQERQPLNGTNLALVTVFAGLFGYGTYWLWVWAVASDNGWIWTLFYTVLALVLIFMAAAIGTLRSPKSS